MTADRQPTTRTTGPTGRPSRALRGTGPAARAGFTLVELLVVIIVLGLMTTVTALNWKKIVPREQLNAAVRDLSNMLNATRSEAIARNAEYRVLYDLDAQRYWVETPFRRDGGLALPRIPGEEDPEADQRATIDETFLEDGVRYVSVTIDDEEYVDGQVFVRFSPQGSSSAHRIVLFHEPTATNQTIEVLGLTGLIRFHEGLYERPEVTDSDFQ